MDKATLHKLVEELPVSALPLAGRLLLAIQREHELVAQALNNAPIEDEPLTEEDSRVAIEVGLDGREVLIEAKGVLKPLPVLEGFVPAGWKDAIYVGGSEGSSEAEAD